MGKHDLGISFERQQVKNEGSRSYRFSFNGAGIEEYGKNMSLKRFPVGQILNFVLQASRKLLKYREKFPPLTETLTQTRSSTRIPNSCYFLVSHDDRNTALDRINYLSKAWQKKVFLSANYQEIEPSF